MAETVGVMVRLPVELHLAVKHRLLDDGWTFKAVVVAALRAYVAGEWSPQVGVER